MGSDNIIFLWRRRDAGAHSAQKNFGRAKFAAGNICSLVPPFLPSLLRISSSLEVARYCESADSCGMSQDSRQAVVMLPSVQVAAKLEGYRFFDREVMIVLTSFQICMCMSLLSERIEGFHS